jgi:ubiquinone biosynthesis accessory factor UbiK
MLHKVLFDAVSGQAARLLMSEKGLPTAELEKRLKALVQSALSKLDVVSREEFETQQVVLMRTRERLEALEKRVDELENRAPSSPI